MVLVIIIPAIILFLGTLTCVGVYLSRQVNGKSSRYIVADRKLMLAVTSATLMAQSIDADITLGVSNLSFLHGFWSGASMIIGLSGALFLIGLFFAEPLNKLKLLTLPDFYRLKYGRKVEIIVSVLMVLSSAIFIGGCFVAVGFIFKIFLGIPYWIGIVTIAICILMYTIPGGLISIAYTDLIQLAVISIGTISLVIFMITTFGADSITGPLALNALNTDPFNVNQLTDPGKGAFVNWAIMLALGFGNIIAIDFMGRIFAANDTKVAKKACYIAGVGTFIMGIPFALIAVSSVDIFTLADISPDPFVEPILLTLLAQVSPIGLPALVVIGILAAAISTADGLALAASSVISHNLLGCMQGNGTNHKNGLLFMSRINTIPVMVLGILFAMTIPTPGILIILSFDLLLAGAVVPFILGIFWSKSNTPAAIAALLCGSLCRLVLFVLTPEFYGMPNNIFFIEGFFTSAFDGLPTIISPIVSLITFVMVAVTTQKSHRPRILDKIGPGKRNSM